MSLLRGSVVLVAYPNSDLSTFKKRPALVVQNDSVRTDLPQVVLALITSRLSRTGETRVRVARESDAGIQMGLLVGSVIVCDVLQTVSHNAVLRIIGECPIMKSIDSTLRATLAL